jgi:hypothetical protein
MCDCRSDWVICFRRKPADALPAHPSPTISGGNAINEVNPAASRQRIET